MSRFICMIFVADLLAFKLPAKPLLPSGYDVLHLLPAQHHRRNVRERTIWLILAIHA